MQPVGDVAVRPLLERQADVEADALAAGLVGAAVGRLHDAGTAARADHEAVPRRFERQAPHRQLVRQLARVLVVARPLDRLAAALHRGEMRLRARIAAPPQALERARRVGAAVHARRAEEHDGVLDVLLLAGGAAAPGTRRESAAAAPRRSRETRDPCTRAAGRAYAKNCIIGGMHIRSSVFAAAGSDVPRRASARQRAQQAPPAASRSPAAGRCRRPPTTRRIRSRATRRRSPPARSSSRRHCQKCHGPGGKGDGPDADPDSMQDMDLTNPKRAARNPDGDRVLQDLERPRQAEDAGAEGRADEGPGLADRLATRRRCASRRC